LSIEYKVISYVIVQADAYLTSSIAEAGLARKKCGESLPKSLEACSVRPRPAHYLRDHSPSLGILWLISDRNWRLNLWMA